MRALKESHGYKPYPYKHYESIFTRFYQGYLLPQKFGADKRRVHFSTLIVAGQMTREEAIRDLENIPYPSQAELDDDRQYFLKKMGWTEAPKHIAVLPVIDGFESPESTPVEDVHYLMQPWHVLQLALANEERAERFFAHLASVATVESVRKAVGPDVVIIVRIDAAGDAVHKIFLTDASDATLWEPFVAGLREAEQGETLAVAPRAPVEAPFGNPDRAADLRDHWGRMTDTHQFLSLVSRLRMNRLGAYRIAGEPLARRLAPEAVTRALEAAAAGEVPIMIFVGNRGCIEIHGGPVRNVVGMGPWINVLDPGLDLHLRQDHVAEVWAVDKPTRRGPAVSIECFDAEGGLIAQIFGVGKAGPDAIAAWQAVVDAQPTARTEPAEALR